ncbi:MAG: sensor histidine kinase, partial [Pseudonocardiaceae bacterium]
IEQTAVAIADGDLDRRIADIDPRTEAGRLGAALNTMLGQISSALREREDSAASLRQFVADASHELRTPLTSIRGFAELCGRPDIGAAEVTRGLQRIEAEAKRMGVLVDDLLLLAHLDARRPLQLTQVDLLVLVVDAVDDARARDPGRPVTLSGDVRSLIVDGDESRLRQVLANLINNAAIHTAPSTAVHVTLRPGASPLPLVAAAGAQPRPGDRAELEVRDFGPGMDSSHAAHVFDRFYRADVGRARANGGSGLGLSIAAAIIAAHGGRIELRTAPDSGASFRIVLPTSQTPSRREKAAMPDRTGQPTRPSQLA